MIELRQSNKDLGIAEYEMLQGIENGENGFMNTVKGMTEARKVFNTNAQISGVLEDYFDEASVDYYDAAKNFAMLNGDLIQAYEDLMVAHPKYGDKRRRATVVDQVLASRGVDYEENFSEVNEAYDEYVAIRSCGYNNVRTFEVKATLISAKINENSSAVVKEGKDAVVKAATTVANGVASVARPYGEVAKGQLKEAGAHAKGLFNKGVKTLIKSLQNLDERTK